MSNINQLSEQIELLINQYGIQAFVKATHNVSVKICDSDRAPDVTTVIADELKDATDTILEYIDDVDE